MQGLYCTDSRLVLLALQLKTRFKKIMNVSVNKNWCNITSQTILWGLFVPDLTQIKWIPLDAKAKINNNGVESL